MRVLGIDTAMRLTGYGVLELSSPGSVSILDCGLIKNSKSIPHSECLRRIAGGIGELVEKFHPDVASIEGAFVDRNIKTAMILSLARGAAITVLAQSSIPIYQYAPKAAKRSAVGNGSASKQQVATVMAALCGLNPADIPDDSTDALALALCHANIAMRPELACLLPRPV